MVFVPPHPDKNVGVSYNSVNLGHFPRKDGRICLNKKREYWNGSEKISVKHV